MKKIKIAAVAAIGMIVLTGCSAFNQQVREDCTVLDKERLLQDGTSGEKRVMTTCGTFTVSDSVFGDFDSYDTYMKLEEGKSYNIKTGGWRIGFFSSFPNVLEVTEAG